MRHTRKINTITAYEKLLSQQNNQTFFSSIYVNLWKNHDFKDITTVRIKDDNTWIILGVQGEGEDWYGAENPNKRRHCNRNANKTRWRGEKLMVLVFFIKYYHHPQPHLQAYSKFIVKKRRFWTYLIFYQNKNIIKPWILSIFSFSFLFFMCEN